ncbi:MAG: GNAT family N-acetyltransferase [Propionivibrio sp.]
MITLAKVRTYQRFSGDLDGWTRTTGGDDSSAIDAADWRMIDELRQALALVAARCVSPDLRHDAERRLTECTDDEATREALRQLAAEDTSIVIREASATDADVLAGIIRDANRDVAVRLGLDATNCPKHPSFCDVEWVKADFARGERYFILDQGGRPAGCVAYETPNAEVAYLNRLSVLPSIRRHGHGKRLVDHVIALARTAATPAISIGVIGEHEDLQRWYRKLGFVRRRNQTLPASAVLGQIHALRGVETLKRRACRRLNAPRDLSRRRP